MRRCAKCLLLLLSGGIGAQGITLAGRVVSSKSRKPLDSVVVRLIASDTAIQSDTDGRFSFGGTVGIDSRNGDGSARTWSVSNGRLLLERGLARHAELSLLDRRGKTLKTTGIEPARGTGVLDLTEAATSGTATGVFALVLSSPATGEREAWILTRVAGRVVSVSGVKRSHRTTRAADPVALRSQASADTLHLWKPGYAAKTIAASNLTETLADIALDSLATPRMAPAPLFRDPLCNGAADPTILWNERDKAFWIYYTNRRATCCPGCTGVQWVFGTDIGIASTYDGGLTWRYRGIAKLQGKKDLNWNTSQNTFWAVEVVYDKTARLYHMYASITPGILNGWNEGIANVVHLSARDPLDGWSYDAVPFKSIHAGIDPVVHQLDDGKWYMWLKNRDRMSSTDLVNWAPAGTFAAQSGEAPYVFWWKGYYWMIQDPTSSDGNAGLTVHRSTDGTNWTKQANILGGSGTRTGEIGVDGKHCSVAVQGDKAYVFYFSEGGNNPTGSALQAAPLAVSASGVLSANRDAPFELALRHFEDQRNRGR